MVNVNIEVPDELHKRTKIAATLSDRTLKAFIIDTLDAAVTEALKDPATYPPAEKTAKTSARRRG